MTLVDIMIDKVTNKNQNNVILKQLIAFRHLVSCHRQGTLIDL